MSLHQAADRAPQDVVDLVETVRALPYGRPAGRTVAAMLAEGRGTCSAKHAYLHAEIEARHPQLRPRIVHRVYAVTREQASEQFGPAAAAAVPQGGLTDVHRYLTIELAGRTVTIDATFPGPPWDGRTPMPLACGDGADEPCVGDPDARKRELERRHCDPDVREAFIAALVGSAR